MPTMTQTLCCTNLEHLGTVLGMSLFIEGLEHGNTPEDWKRRVRVPVRHDDGSDANIG